MRRINYEIINGDCLTEMAKLPAASVDAVITDLPYGTTACSWDVVIPFEPMWKELKRLVKPKSAIVLFGSQPFTTLLINSNLKNFKYQWIWNKKLAGNFLNMTIQPAKIHEDILVFGGQTYHPQMQQGQMRIKGTWTSKPQTVGEITRTASRNDLYFPQSILEFGNTDRRLYFHPTQKPVELLRYLVRTYTQTGETVLDFTAGSFTTGVACAIENRNFIGIEKDSKYCELGRARIERAMGNAVEMPRIVTNEKPMPLFEME
jgi:DNA modification methylase